MDEKTIKKLIKDQHEYNKQRIAYLESLPQNKRIPEKILTDLKKAHDDKDKKLKDEELEIKNKIK